MSQEPQLRRYDEEVYIVTDRAFNQFVRDVKPKTITSQGDSESFFIELTPNRLKAKEFATKQEAIHWIAGYVRAGVVFKEPCVVKLLKRHVYSPPIDVLEETKKYIEKTPNVHTFLVYPKENEPITYSQG